MLTISDLADRMYRDHAIDDRGLPTEPLIVVDLDTSVARIGEAVLAAQSISGRSAVVVGVMTETSGTLDPLLSALDVTLSAAEHRDTRVATGSVEGSLAAIEEATTVAPQAAIALGALLRLTSALPVGDGLIAESFAYSTLLAGREFATWRSGRDRRDIQAPEEETVRVERKGSTLTITLANPKRRNAFSAQLRHELVEGLRLAELDPSIELIELRGEGPSFCSGGDLDEFGTTPDPVTAHLIRTTCSAAGLLHRLRDRVHVFVHGACVGAGMELPAFAGRVTADAEAFFLLPEIRMGLVPGAGGTVGITRRIGRWRTTHLALTGERIGSATALEWGLVDDLLAA